MSGRVVRWVWEHGPEDPGQMLVMLALADYADDYGWSYPAVDSLAKKTRMSRRGVQNVLQKLVADGRLGLEKGAGQNGTNRYKILRKKAEGGAVSAPPNGGELSAQGGELIAPPAQPVHPGGRTECTQTITSITEVSLNSSVTPSSSTPSAQTVLPPPPPPPPPPPEKPKAERFAEFWDDAYPHLEAKIARGKCEAKYRALVASGVDEAAIIGGARSYAKSRRVLEGKVCNPLTWLNQRRWEDEAADIIPIHSHPASKGKTNGTAEGFRIAMERRRARGMGAGPGDDASVPLLPAGRGPYGRVDGG